MSNEQAHIIINMLEGFKKDNDDDHQAIITRLDKTNGNVTKNTEFRLKTEGGLLLLKFLLGFIGLGNLIILIKLFS